MRTEGSGGRVPPQMRFHRVLLVLGQLVTVAVAPEAFWLTNCNGRGEYLSAEKKCACLDGFGSTNDISDFKDPSCGKRVCPAGQSWVGIPSGATTGLGLAECSNMGLCDRGSGKCNCFYEFEGPACERMGCPKGCSGHGQCLSIKEIGSVTTLHPLSLTVNYGGDEVATTWDENRIMGCLCDSAWPVGLQHGEWQLGQYYGADCTLKRCPSGDDPMTPVNETDCHGKSHNGAGTASNMLGQKGNGCVVECSNRGLCDSASGACECFAGYTGAACEIKDVLAERI